MQEAFNRKTADNYVKGISNDAALHGVSAAAIAGKKRPILVRVYSESDNVGDMGAESNKASSLGLGAVEQAKTDARALPRFSSFTVSENGELLTSVNSGFVMDWFRALGMEEAATLKKSAGYPNKKAGERLSAAIFHEAYKDDALTEAATEEVNSGIKNILHALTISAPSFATIDKDGALGNFVKTISKAVQIFKSAKRADQPVEEYVKQLDILSKRDALAEQLALYFAKNNRAPRRLGDQLQEIARLILAEQGAGTSFDMFGRNSLSESDIMRMLETHQESTNDETRQSKQSGLFDEAPAKPGSAEAATGSNEAESKQAEPAGTVAEVVKPVAEQKPEAAPKKRNALKEGADKAEAARAAKKPAPATKTQADEFSGAKTVSEAMSVVAKHGNEFEKALANRIAAISTGAFRVIEAGVSVPGGVPSALQGDARG